MIWCSEMKRLDQKLGKEKIKILLLVDNCSAHKKVPQLQNIELLFIMAGATSFLQVSTIKLILNFCIASNFFGKQYSIQPLDACTIAVIKNRFKKWLNRLPVDSCPKKWERIQEFVQTIWTTEKETILKAWDKTKLTTNFDFEKELANPDVEEEFILQMEMKKLMIDDFQSDDESCEDEVFEIRTVPAEKEKKVKQSQITDFFVTNKQLLKKKSPKHSV